MRKSRHRNGTGRTGRPRRPLHLVLLVLALVILAEEWLWEHLKGVMRRLATVPAVAALERRLRGLSPVASLLVLLAPALLLLPFKVLALWALAHGHPAVGLLVLLAAKLCGTAAAAFVFDRVRDSARQVRWFDRAYRAVTRGLDRCRAWVHRHPVYRQARARLHALRVALRQRLARPSRLARKYKAARVVGTRWQCCLL